MALVRQPRRRSSQLLHLALQELQNLERLALWKERARARRQRHDREPQLDGQELTALNGGPEFAFNEAISFQVLCETQEEVDEFWNGLSEGGEEGPCGWLKDRYGVSWQIVPTILGDLLSDSESGNSEAAMQAMLQMRKLDIETLEAAYRQ
jgi:predicted 3-demethylubiquinone-9 3-methyltransferase (glyoxalase superfamily)